MSRKKSAVNQAIDSFVSSVNQTGEGFAGLAAAIFILGGLFGTYIGYTDNAIMLLAAGLVTILIGLMIGYKALNQQTAKSRRRR